MKLYPVNGPVSGYFAEAPAPDQLSYYGDTPEVGYVYEVPQTIDYYGEPPEPLAYYGDGPEVGYFADPPPGFIEGQPQLAYFADVPEGAAGTEDMGYFYDAPDVGYVSHAPDTVGYYGDAPEFADVPAEMGYIDEDLSDCAESDVGYYGEPDLSDYAESEEITGYGEPDDMGYFAEDEVSGYIPESQSLYSPRVVPVDKIGGFDGFYTPKSVNPTCESLRPAEKVRERSTEWFKPHW